MSVIDQLRRGVVAISERAQKQETSRLVRKLVVSTAALARKPAEFMSAVAGIQKTADLFEAEAATWVPSSALAEGLGGPFDACDLRHWLALAERAGVPAVPAREILVLDDDEMDAASGSIRIPDAPVSRRMRERIAAMPGLEDARGEIGEEPQIDREALSERLASAMDGVPEGWMVRYARCGPANLKALAGMGVSGPTVPEVRFGPDLEVGPGWVRHGNRRSVHPADNRTAMAAGQGPGGAHAFLARPWMPAARWMVGEDPHRHGTAYAGKGAWPAEWRAFVEKGEVVGVAAYYGWCGEAGGYDAIVACMVRQLAQKVVDEAVAQKAWPRLMDVELLRAGANEKVLERPGVAAGLELFGREDVACTLDFIEVEDQGLVLLEGGPANTPFGGGHPCAFAGCGGQPVTGNKTETVGVAFRTMDHVHLGDPATWLDGDRVGRILSWAEVEVLAADYAATISEESPAPAA